MNARSALLILQLTIACMVAPAAARAAETYHTCAGFITSLPTVINTQGTWCLKQDLTTAITTGNAITINTNNVTIDCNDFKLGGLAAGAGTQTTGIYGLDRLNSTIRHCNIRGFLTGIRLEGNNSGGNAIEDNRFDGNTFTGMSIYGGDGSIIQRNRVFDTGGTTTATSYVVAIATQRTVDIVGNSVAGVVALTGSGENAYGITTDDISGGNIIGNGVRDLLKDGIGSDYAIYNSNSGRLLLRDNNIYGDGSAGGVGLRCTSGIGRARDNEIANFATGISGCTSVSGNDIN